MSRHGRMNVIGGMLVAMCLSNVALAGNAWGRGHGTGKPDKDGSPPYCSPPVTAACSPPPYVCPPPVTVASPPAYVCPPPVTVASPPAYVCPPPVTVASPPAYVCPPPVSYSKPPRYCTPPVTVTKPPRYCTPPVSIRKPPPYCAPVKVSKPPKKGVKCGNTYCKKSQSCCKVKLIKWWAHYKYVSYAKACMPKGTKCTKY